MLEAKCLVVEIIDFKQKRDLRRSPHAGALPASVD
jgi:hypothetical protein